MLTCAYNFVFILLTKNNAFRRTQNMVDPYFIKYQVQAVQEMVKQSASHPSVIMHGFYNEGPDNDPKACAGYNASADAIRALAPMSHRMVTWASSQKEKGVCWSAADILSFNDYPGWYTASVPQIGSVWKNHTDWVQKTWPTKPFIASETGAGAIYEWMNTSEAYDGYTLYGGAYQAGSDLTSTNATWTDAMAYCNKTEACVGFTFKGGVGAQRPTSPVQVYFKSAGAIINMDGSWTTWAKGSNGPAPKWSQGYQATVVTADIAAILSNDRASGIAVWQFNDIKADPSDFHPRPGPEMQDCQACVYSTKYDAKTPMNCSYISTSCFRPGGENHKGAVDFWRRPKLGFQAAKKCFTKGC